MKVFPKDHAEKRKQQKRFSSFDVRCVWCIVDVSCLSLFLSHSPSDIHQNYVLEKIRFLNVFMRHIVLFVKNALPLYTLTQSPFAFCFVNLRRKNFDLRISWSKKNQKLVFGVCISFFSWNRTQTIRFNSITFAFSPFLLFAEKDSDNDLFGRDCSDFNNTFNNLFDASLRRLRLRELTATEMFTSCFEFSLCQLLDLSKKNNNYCKHFLAH